ncbi:MAG: NAD-dependent deacetylase [Coprobacillus sp.]|nr:NAD-dependent deacetylase [Coprobacillus sp.]
MNRKEKKMSKEIDELVSLINSSKYTVAVTGSGISYLYGMSRLKGSVSNRASLMSMLTPNYVYSHSEEFFTMMWHSFLEATFVKGPSKVHYQLVELERKGKLQGIVTQNLDCLHTIAGSTNVIEFQGSFRDNTCVKCGEKVYDYNVWNQGHAPRCPKCDSPLMPSNFIGRPDPSKMKEAVSLISHADLILVIGTTGFRSEEYLSKMRKEAKLVQINPSPTVFNGIATLNIGEPAEDVFSEVLTKL